MRLESAKLLEDIRRVAVDAIEMAAGKTLDDYLTDRMLRYAVERCFEIAGEALTKLNRVDPATAQSISDWRAIIGFRNVLIHAYAAVLHDKTWDIVEHELPVLLREVQALLQQPVDPETPKS